MWKVNRLQWQLMFLKMVKPRSHWIANSEIRSGTVLRCITVWQNVIKGNWVLCRQFATVLDAGVSSPLRKLGIWWVYQGKATFKAHLHCIRDLGPSPSSDAIKTSELMFRVYTGPSPRFLSRTSVSELVATCSDFLGRGRLSTSKVMKWACSKPPVHVVAAKLGPKWPWTQMTSDPSLGYSVNTILSGSQTQTRTRMLGQCKCKYALTLGATRQWWMTSKHGVWGVKYRRTVYTGNDVAM